MIFYTCVSSLCKGGHFPRKTWDSVDITHCYVTFNIHQQYYDYRYNILKFQHDFSIFLQSGSSSRTFKRFPDYRAQYNTADVSKVRLSFSVTKNMR